MTTTASSIRLTSAGAFSRWWGIKQVPNCSSCGSEIPEGQGSSCSMCYGDASYGRDGYYQKYIDDQEAQWLAEQMQEAEAEKAHEQYVKEQIEKEKEQ